MNVQDEIEAHEFGLTTATCAKSNVKVAYVDVVPFLVVSTGKYGHRVHWLYHTKRSGQQKRANLREAGNVCAKTFLIAMFVSVSFCRQDFMVVAQLLNLKLEFMENSVKKLAKKKQKNQAFNEYLYIWYRQA